MLKFSGFANLTSCLESLNQAKQERRAVATDRAAIRTQSMLNKLAVAAEPYESNASGAPAHILRHRQSQQHAPTERATATGTTKHRH